VADQGTADGAPTAMTAAMGELGDRVEQFVEVGALRLCVARREHRRGVPLLLIAGLGMQLIAWPEGFLTALEEVGFDVVTYDQRDVGRSSFFDEAGPPDLLRALRHDRSRLAYGLEELAGDAVSLLGALGIDRAHVFGTSMGAMVGQVLALNHPERVASLCSAMGSTGDRTVGQSSNAALGVLLRPAATSEEEVVAQRLAQLAVTSGGGEVIDEATERRRALQIYRRSHHAVGSARHLAALLAAPDRTAALGSLRLPVVVIHGEDDQMIDPSGGRGTAAAIPAAGLLFLKARAIRQGSVTIASATSRASR
jgi:pimeloyl-ACP methyl ester carboxylesterase